MQIHGVPLHAEGNMSHQDCEDGRITSLNSVDVFVRYDGTSETSQATSPDDLVWQHHR
ncbi:MAG: hypothetical protein HC841_00465 [Verrucomicrobiae bacterium]|nr:hypothetical protein [Verrucomicrobiae bacterium]